MFERMHFVANRRNQQIPLHLVLLIHHCDSRLLDLCSRQDETKEISKRPLMTIYAQCKTLTASHPTSTLPPRRTIDGTNAVRRRHCSPAELKRRNSMKRSSKPDKPASRQSEIARGTPPARTRDALPETDVQPDQAPRARYLGCCPYQPSTGRTVTPTARPRSPWHAGGAYTRAAGSGGDLRRGKDKASQGKRRADKPLQQGGLERSQVILRRQMKQPSLNARQAFADISQHVF